jgi:broad specificity phosphatase PhoE
MIWLVRHGQTAFNAEGRIQGAKDSALTTLGEEQGRRLGQLLGRIAPKDARLIASPLGRTQHTARLIREHGGFASPIETDPRLAEISLGDWDGMLKDDIREIAPAYDAGPSRWSWFFNSPGGEGYDALAARLGSWLADAACANHPIIAISHGVSGRILRGLFAQLPRDQTLKLDIPQDACFHLRDGRIDRVDG